MKISLGERKERIMNEVSGAERLSDVLSNALGYKITKKGGYFKLSLREERTPSAVVNKDGTVHDFGSGETFTFLSLVAKSLVSSTGNKGKDFLSEIKRAEEILGINGEECNYVFSSPKLSEVEKTRKAYNNKPIDEEYITYFRSQAIINQKRVAEFSEMMMPGTSYDERINALTKFEVGYDPKRDRLTFPVRGFDGVCTNLFKYTPLPAIQNGEKLPKILYMSGRERGLFNLEVLKTRPKRLYILEGEKDVINASISGMAAITQGSAGNWRERMAIEIKDACDHLGLTPEIIIIQDHDMPGIVSTLKIFNDIKTLFSKVRMNFWKKETVKWLLKKSGKKTALGTKCKMSKLMETTILTENEVAIVKNTPKLLSKGFDYTEYRQSQSKNA